jgi:hypothetical protein
MVSPIDSELAFILLEYVITYVYVYVYVYGVVLRPYTYILVLPRRGLFSTLYNT